MASVCLSIQPHTIIITESGLSGGILALNHLDSINSTYTAIVTSDDILAAGVLKELALLNKQVSKDIVVFGYDNSIISQRTTPEIFTVDNKVGSLAKDTANILCRVLQEEKIQTNNTVIPNLILKPVTLYER